MHVGSGSSARAMAMLEDMSCRWQLTKVKWLSRTRRGRRTCTTRRWQTGPNASIPRHAFALLRRVRQTLFPLLPPPPRSTLLLTNPPHRCPQTLRWNMADIDVEEVERVAHAIVQQAKEDGTLDSQ